MPHGARFAQPAAAAAAPTDEVERGENLLEDDDREVTTLEGGSEERVAPSRKQQVEDEGEPVEQIGGDALEEIPRRTPRLRRQYKFRRSSSVGKFCWCRLSRKSAAARARR